MKAFHKSFPAMGTRFEAVIPGNDSSLFNAVFNDIEVEVKRIETRLNRFDPASDISLLNSRASDKPVVVDEEIFNIIVLCKKYSQATNGLFDVTVGPLLQLWNIHHGVREQVPVPTDEEVQKLLPGLGQNNIICNDEDSTIFLNSPQIEVDLGGFAKGYALEKVQHIIEKKEIQNAFISFGESSVLAIGKHPFGEYWPVGICNIFHQQQSIHTIQLTDSSVSTSGINSKTDMSNGTIYGHIIHPKTGFPVVGIQTCTVVSPSPLDAEVLSTALLIANQEEQKSIFKAFPEVSVVNVKYKNQADYQIEFPYS